MTYDYFTINFPSISGFIFLLIFLYANSSLDKKVKHIFFLLILVEFIEMLTYSLELWTTTFETLSPLRLWLSAVGYSVRPPIFLMFLMLALRNRPSQQFPKIYYLPTILNVIAAFSVFFTDIVYSYTADNFFLRGPLGFFTHIVVVIYLVLLINVVIRNHQNRPKLEVLIILAISLLILFGMVIEAAYSIRTIGRASIIMVTIFYFMYFQSQIHNESLTKEQIIRLQLEQANRIDVTTGTLNKAAFIDTAKALLYTPDMQPPSSVGFVFLDLDHLKEVNDTLGHAVGDTAIKDVAETIRHLCRKTDLVGRFGGDEFCVVLPDIPKNRFLVLLNEANSRFLKKYTNDDASITVTASIGAVYTENIRELNYEQLVQLADEALYEAKAAGRNCFIFKEI